MALKSVWIIIFCFVTILVRGQVVEEKYHTLCSRSAVERPYTPLPLPHPEPSENIIPCSLEDVSEFALLDAQQLFIYLSGTNDPQECINRKLYGFHSEYSPTIFSEDRVLYVAQNTVTLARSFDGETDNGVFGTFIYLSIAGLHATFNSSQISFSPTTWEAIRDACRELSRNKDVLAETNVSLYTLGHMFFAASFDDIGADPDIVALAKDHLDNIANDSYQTLTDLYPYYYCYYYILDVYFRYPTVLQVFVDEIVNQSEIITSLGAVATNLNLNSDTYIHFNDLSNQSVIAITRHAPYAELHHVVEPALTSVTEAYDVDDSKWVHAALALVRNGMNFQYTEEELLGNLRDALLPNTFKFDDGKIRIYTALTYEEVISLYQSILQVKAQFFRMLEHDRSVPGDTNDTLNIVLYGQRDAYRDFNELLFGINYPNSGGVYIENNATFYTYQRTSSESVYSLEELFRHEYTHYLQGRYLIPGQWGQSPIYDNSRLVWFEEGMAQFFSGSTRYTGIKTLELIRDQILDTGITEDLEGVLSSSYSSGNPNAFYIYAPLLWAKWYHQDRSKIKTLFDLIIDQNLTQFDIEVNYYRNSLQENSEYVSFIDSLVIENNHWTRPNTIGILPHEVDYQDLIEINQEVVTLAPELNISSIEVEVVNDPRQFKLSGQLNLDESDNDSTEFTIRLNNELNNFLNVLESSVLNNFEYTTGYYHNVQTGSGVGAGTASFNISGPLNDICRPLAQTAMQSESYDNHVLLFAPTTLNFRHQFRFREVNSIDWMTLDQSLNDPDTLNNLSSPLGYEFQISQECAEEVWSEFSNSKFFWLCPDQLSLEGIINQNLTYSAAFNVLTSSTIADNTIAEFASGQLIEFLPGFEIQEGATFTTSNNNCRTRQ